MVQCFYFHCIFWLFLNLAGHRLLHVILIKIAKSWILLTNFVCLLFVFVIEVFAFYKIMHSKVLNLVVIRAYCIVGLAYRY